MTGGRIELAVEYSRRRDISGRIELAATGLELDSSEPWPLALALLTDSARRTEIDAPIGPAVGVAAAEAALLAVRSRLAAVAAAPFDTLGRVAGRDGSMLRAIAFEPGTAEPSAAGTDTIDALAAALRERPLVALAVGGGYDPRADRDALASQQIALHVTLATAGAAPQARPRPVDFASPRAQDILDEFARERLGAERVQAIAARLGFDPALAADAPTRVAYYRALFDALAANESIAASALERLGRFRGRSIAAALAERGIEPDRVLLRGEAASVAAGPDGVAVPVEVVGRAPAPVG